MDPAFFVSGDPGPTARKQPGCCFLFCFISPQLSLQRGSNGFIAEKTILSHGSRTVPTFSRGVQLFPRGGGGGGGLNANFYRNPYSL